MYNFILNKRAAVWQLYKTLHNNSSECSGIITIEVDEANTLQNKAVKITHSMVSTVAKITVNLNCHDAGTGES